MSATPGAKSEYSRGSGLSGRGSGGDFDRFEPPRRRRTALSDGGAGGLILAGALLAALLLLAAEFTTLFEVHVATSSTPVKTVTGGSNHSYAMIPIALLAAALGVGAWRTGSRAALIRLVIAAASAPSKLMARPAIHHSRFSVSCPGICAP